MSTFDAIKKGLTVILAAGGLAGPIAVIVYTSSRASAEDLDNLKTEHAVLQRAHDDLAMKTERDRAEMLRRLDRMDEKQDRVLELLETPRRRGR
jgi:hypothetical protein